MYIPNDFAFEEGATERLHELIEAYSFGILVAPMPGAGGEPPRLEATHLPFILERGRGRLGTLTSHVARANPIWSAFAHDREVLVIFQGPHTYISPDWYANPGLVPTWNYVAVHAYGTARIIDDEAAVFERLARLVALTEEGLRPKRPWHMADVPEEILQAMSRGLVAFDLEIGRLEGKQKLNQNRAAADRAGVIEALSAATDPDARAIAARMRALDPA